MAYPCSVLDFMSFSTGVSYDRMADPCPYPMSSVPERMMARERESCILSPGSPYVQDDRTASSPSSYVWYAPSFSGKCACGLNAGALLRTLGLPRRAFLAFGLLRMQISESIAYQAGYGEFDMRHYARRDGSCLLETAGPMPSRLEEGSESIKPLYPLQYALSSICSVPSFSVLHVILHC